MRIATLAAALVAMLAIPTQSQASLYIEYRITGYASLDYMDVNQPPFPYTWHENLAFILNTGVTYNNPDWGTGVISVGPLLAFARPDLNHLFIDKTWQPGPGADSLGVDVCFDHDLGGNLPTNASGFLSNCSGIGGYSFGHYSGYYINGVVKTFSAQLVERSGTPGWFNLEFLEPSQLNSGVPEPSTWTMMILGFGLVGTAMRGRRNSPTKPLSEMAV